MSTAVARDKGLSSTTNIDGLPTANLRTNSNIDRLRQGAGCGWLHPTARKVQPFRLPGPQRTSLTAAFIGAGIAGLVRVRHNRRINELFGFAQQSLGPLDLRAQCASRFNCSVPAPQEPHRL